MCPCQQDSFMRAEHDELRPYFNTVRCLSQEDPEIAEGN